MRTIHQIAIPPPAMTLREYPPPLAERAMKAPATAAIPACCVVRLLDTGGERGFFEAAIGEV
jgi:hypothetical protein